MNRQNLCRLCYHSSQRLLLPHTIAGYASFYLHKYLNFQMVSVDSEVKEQDAELLLTSVLYLACKVSEQFRTIRDVFNVVKAIMNPGIVVSDLDKLYIDRKEEIIAMEHSILRVLKFEPEIDLAYQYLFNIARYLFLCRDVVRIANNLLNDLHQDPLIVQEKAENIGLATILVAIKISQQLGLAVSTKGPRMMLAEDGKRPWWADFSDEEEILLRISRTIVRLWQTGLQGEGDTLYLNKIVDQNGLDSN